MDMYNKYKSPFGYEVGENGIDSYGVDHSGFTLRDEIEYQTARDNRESQMMQMYNSQGITENYPQYTTNFWGDAGNNYGFGSSNISSAISTHPAMNTTPTPLQAGQTLTPQKQTLSSWDKFKGWVENTGDTIQAGAVGYATGATLGNFDEAMGATTAAATFNPDNYAMGRDAVRQLQNDLSQRHPIAYGGAEALGATLTGMFTKPVLVPVAAGLGYANDINDIPVNIEKNAAVSRYTNGIQKIDILPKKVRDFGQNAASEYLLNKEKQEK